MKNEIACLKAWAVNPFGSPGTFLLAAVSFLGAVATDLASTHYFLSQFAWDCTAEDNPVSEAIFCSTGFYPGAAVIWSMEPLILFFGFFPLLYSRVGRRHRKRVRRVNVVSILSLSIFFVLVALDNWDVIDIHPFIERIVSMDLTDFQKDMIAGASFTCLASLATLLFPVPRPLSKSPSLAGSGIFIP